MFLTLLFWVMILLFVALVVIHPDTVATPYLSDALSPLNVVLHPPSSTRHHYNAQMVTDWIEKPWRSDGSRIPVLRETGFPSSPSSKRPNGDEIFVIFTHAGDETLTDAGPMIRKLATELGTPFLTWDPSGYGLNAPNNWERSADGINRSLQAVIDYTVIALGVPLQNIVLMGSSLGTGPSLFMAQHYTRQRKPLRGVILLSAFTSIRSVLTHRVNGRFAELFEERWNNLLNIKSLVCPTLIIHGKEDSMVPVSHARALANAAHGKAKLLEMSHTGHKGFDWTRLAHSIRQFLDETRTMEQLVEEVD